MRKIIILIFIVMSATVVFSQEYKTLKILNGEVEYISSQFTYVRFENTKGLKVSDTLYIQRNGKYSPKLIIESLSSRSCAARPIKESLSVGTKLFGLIKSIPEQIDDKQTSEISKPRNEEINKAEVSINNKHNAKKDYVKGRFSISGYSNFSNSGSNYDYQKWRYSLSLNAEKLNDSRFSFSSYISFKYRANEWESVGKHFSDALKIYDLSIKYSFSEKSHITVGRKINRKIANIGAVDGIQYETEINKFTFGAIFGSRPDFNNYGFNSKLMEFGGFASRTDSIGNGAMQNTISLLQQMNNSTTDRRFLYLQHSNNIIGNTNLFLSSEIDLFEKLNDQIKNKPRFTSFYMSLRYSPYRWFSANISYDARKNVIYYESFKNYAEQLAEDALRQGFRIRLNLRPIKFVTANVFMGYRYRESDKKPTRNYGGSLTYSRIPYLGVSANFNFLKLITNYLDGDVLGIRITKDLFRGLVNSSFGYKRVDYQFIAIDDKLLQDIILLDLSLRVIRNLSFSLSYEGTYQNKLSYSNIFIHLSARF